MMTRGSQVSTALVLVLASGAFAAFAQRPTLQNVVAFDPDFAEAAIMAAKSVHVTGGVQVNGQVVANEAFASPTLVAGRSVQIDKPAVVTGDVFGDRVGLAKNAAVSGAVHYNQIFNAGASVGSLVTPLSLPVLAPLPPFHAAEVNPGAANVNVGGGQTVTLPPGSYGDILVAQGGTLVFAGGVYDVRSIGLIVGSGTCNFPCRRFYFAAASDVRVENRFDAGSAAAVGPAPSSGVLASQIIVYVGGANGGTGGPTATPAAAHVGRDSAVGANLFAAFGTVQIDRDSDVTGALIGLHVKVDQNSTVVEASFFANLAPIAHPTTAFTNGTATINILLEATDPESEDMTFSIVEGSGPTFGTLGPVVQAPAPFPGNPPGCNPVNDDPCDPPGPARSSATVTYTPSGSGDVEDSFVFAATDPHGAVGTAVVRINPPGDPTTPDDELDTVRANDSLSETTLQSPVDVTLVADAPDGVTLTYSVISLPANGTLVDSAENPIGSVPHGLSDQLVTYTAESGFIGLDSFVFEACGLISAVTVCDQATATIDVADLATDQEVTTPQNTELTVFLSGVAGTGGSARRNIKGKAAVNLFADVAGNVADSFPVDGLGDNHNDLPGPTPVFMSAGVFITGGGPGSDGVSRIHIEWDISDFAGTANLESATVTLNTHRGTIDSLDTFFYASGSDGNGTLEDGDFETVGEQIGGAVMPVPPVLTFPVGSDGTFSFSVLPELSQALAEGRDFFVVQGRVSNETAAFDGQRGLEVRTSADGNVAVFDHPQLEIATPGVTPPPFTFTVLTLPAFGVLRDSFGTVITAENTLLVNQIVRYTPNASFLGDDAFNFQVEDQFEVTATATIFINVHAIVANCQDGRGC